MNSTPFRPARLLRVLFLVIATVALCPPVFAATNPKSTPAQAFRLLAADPWISRGVSLADLGITSPLVLGSPDAKRDIYFPVPPGAPLANGEVHLNASYLRADPARTTMLVALDSTPASSRAFSLEKGNAGVVVGVDGAARPGGFVRLGLEWNTAMGAEVRCDDARAVGNVLRVEPDSRFTYSYDGRAIRDLATAWKSLPHAPVILISSTKLSPAAYESAWRMGLALERAGKRVRFVVPPSAGDEVELGQVDIPAGLRGVPAFAALAEGGRFKIGNSAQAGALMALGQNGPLHADIVIADAALAASTKSALDALREHLRDVSPEALEDFAAWRAQALDPFARPLAPREIRLSRLWGRPMIVISADAGVEAAGLFSAHWNRLAASSSLVVANAEKPAFDAPVVSLAYLGGQPGSFNVLAHGDWVAGFDLATASIDGGVPRKLVIDVSAAPSAARTPPVASVFLNDVLLGARQLEAKGERERIFASIPGYALAARNTIRVSFVRQLSGDHCRETPEPYPVAVLPSSHIALEKGTPSDDFNGMVLRYATGAHVLAPAAYLTDAAATLPRAIRIAATVGVSPLNATFNAAQAAPTGPFLALEVPVAGAKQKVVLSGGKFALSSRADRVVFDVAGLEPLGVLEVAQAGGHTGVTYRTAGSAAPAMDKPLYLARGDVAMLGAKGLLAEFHSSDPAGRGLPGDHDAPWMQALGYWWIVPIVAIALMLLLLIQAGRARRRRAAERDRP